MLIFYLQDRSESPTESSAESSSASDKEDEEENGHEGDVENNQVIHEFNKMFNVGLLLITTIVYYSVE